MKKLSVQTKYTLVLVAILAVLVGLQLAFNQVFMAKYYQARKLDRIEEIRSLVLEHIAVCDSGQNTEASELMLQKRCEAAGVDVMVMKLDSGMGLVIFSNGKEFGGGPGRLFDVVRGMPRQEELEVYAEGEDYRTYRTKDAFTGTDQIDCVGVVKTGGEGEKETSFYYVLTVALAEITETAGIYNTLLIRVGLVTILVGAVTMYLVSGSLAKPIKQMTSLSRKMADMDFSERYTGSSGDEIQTLGDNMNEMATKLETAIENLKTANAKLAQDISEKDEIDCQRRELLSNISHELKTPIAVIQGYAEGLKDGVSEDPEMRERYCAVIMDEAGKMNRMVRQLLNLDELESRGASAEKERFDLAEMLRGEANAFFLRSQNEGVELCVEVPETLEILSDSYLWEQVIQNYLSNAFQYVSPGGTVRISAATTNKDGVRITVSNSGDSIPEASLEKLWNKFYKVDKARTRAYGGSGIGLSIVKAAMDNLGGVCSARNIEGGVEFTAELAGCLVQTEN